MNRAQIAAQLYTVRDHLRDSSSVASSLTRIQKMGYNAVQVSGLGAISDDELVRILDGEGLTCCATHEPAELILRSPHRVAERLEKLNCRYAAYPFPVGWRLDTEQSVDCLARALDRSGEALRQAGKTLTYHNHMQDLQRLNGATVLDRIYSVTSPENLQAEIDTYWVQAGGGNPVAWVKALNDRVPLLHIKDFVVDRENKPTFAEIGSGNLPWKEIIAAGDEAGCVWYIIEQDANWIRNDPFESLNVSLRFVEENLCTSPASVVPSFGA